MRHVHYDEVALQEVKEPGAEGARVRWLISEDDSAPRFYMRRFELSPGGSTPRHAHAWEHEVYILEGEGAVFCEGLWSTFRPGDVIYIAPDEEHSFKAGQGEVAFLCLIPRKDAPAC